MNNEDTLTDRARECARILLQDEGDKMRSDYPSEEAWDASYNGYVHRVDALADMIAAIMRDYEAAGGLYRPLQIGEKIIHGDQYLQDGRWHPVHRRGNVNGTIGQLYDNVKFNRLALRHLPHRRPIISAKPSQ